MRRFEPVLTEVQQRQVRRARLFETSQLWLLGVFAVVLLLCAIRDNLLVGQIAVGVFALLGLVLRVRADLAFKAALGTFVAIPLATMLASGTGVPENLAVFGFLLLVVGVVFSLAELLRQSLYDKTHKRPRQTVRVMRPSSLIRGV